MLKDWEYRWAFIFLSFSGGNFVIKFISTPRQCQALLQEVSSQEKGLELLRPMIWNMFHHQEQLLQVKSPLQQLIVSREWQRLGPIVEP
jgi:hypothetical protein